MDGPFLERSKKNYTTEEKSVYNAMYKVLNAIICANSQEEFKRINTFQVAKEAWDLLEVTHEGTRTMKRSKFHMLTTRFETLRMK